MEKRKMEVSDFIDGGCTLGVFLNEVYRETRGNPCDGCNVPNCILKRKMASSPDIRKVPSTTCPKCNSLINRDKVIMQYKKTHKVMVANMGTCRACGTDISI